MAEPKLPIVEEIEQLPRWARMAFAARCARRVLPLFGHYWPDAPLEHVVVVARAVGVAERAAANDDVARAAANAVAKEVMAASDSACGANVSKIFYAAAYAIDPHPSRSAYAVRCAATAAQPFRVLREMRTDFDLLARAAGQQRWTDNTPVRPEFFGPMWPDGVPNGWPVQANPAPVQEPVLARSPTGSGHAPTTGTDGPIFVVGDLIPHVDEMWELVEKLGKGGFGQVWLVRNHGTNELRAVKFCTHDVARKQRLITHESKVIRHVQKHTSGPEGCHPNIVPLLDFNLTGDTPWLMYEYVPGGRTLADEITANAPRPTAARVKHTVRLMHTVATAVGQFHHIKVPIVHRDLKPWNILIDGDTPRITDFGIGGAAVTAAIFDATSGPTLTVDAFTFIQRARPLRHASPQQTRGEPPDPRDDVYALGVTIYQLLTGRADAEVKGNWQRRLRGDGVPEALIDLIGDCASEEAGDRPSDGSALADELAKLLPNDAPAEGT